MSYLKRICAVILSAAMIVGLSDGVGSISYAAVNVEKEEAVYVNQKADGEVEAVTVSDWLKNITGKEEVTDQSNLTDIKNVKGNESFEQRGYGELIWKTEQADIYYQGTTDQTPPVGIKISYQLNGTVMEPLQMAGKDGKVKITIQYNNYAAYEEEIGGKATTLYTPFLMASAVILPVDVFSNVTVSRGKIVSEGSNQILVTYGMPGLLESLDLSQDFKEAVDEKLSDTVTITADVKNFSLGSIYTAASAELFSDIQIKEEIDIEDVEQVIDDLVDATDELISGSGELSEGLTTLKNNFKNYASGVDDVSTGAADLSDGAQALAKGVTQYTDGVKTLTSGTNQYIRGTQSLIKGIEEYVAGEKLMDAGLLELYNQTKDFPTQYSKFSEGLLSYISGVNQIANVENTKKLSEASKAVCEGITTVNEGLGQLSMSCESCNSALQALNTINTDAMEAKDREMLEQAIKGIEGALDSQKTSVKALKKATASDSGLAVAANSILETMNILNTKAKELAVGGEQLKGYNGQIGSGISGVSQGISGLYDGIKKLSAGNETLLAGTKTLAAKGVDLTAGAGQLTDSTKTLTSSANTLSKGAGKLSKGTKKLDGATKEISSGVDKLQGGSVDLFNGMNQFKNEGIGKLQNEYDDNIKTVLERVQSLKKGADDYKSFSGIADGMDGTVKFIFQTAEISLEQE